MPMIVMTVISSMRVKPPAPGGRSARSCRTSVPRLPSTLAGHHSLYGVPSRPFPSLLRVDVPHVLAAPGSCCRGRPGSSACPTRRCPSWDRRGCAAGTSACGRSARPGSRPSRGSRGRAGSPSLPSFTSVPPICPASTRRLVLVDGRPDLPQGRAAARSPAAASASTRARGRIAEARISRMVAVAISSR